MSTFFITLGIAFLIMLICVTLLGVGHLIKGKPRLTLGSCGRDPTQGRNKKKGCDTGPICTICGKTDFEKEEEKEEQKKKEQS